MLYFSESIFFKKKPHSKIHFVTWDMHILLWLFCLLDLIQNSDLWTLLGALHKESAKTFYGGAPLCLSFLINLVPLKNVLYSSSY